MAVDRASQSLAVRDTNLTDANTVFQTGAVTVMNTIDGPASFEEDGYHIQITSAAVGAGLDGLSIVDIDGDARPWPAGSWPDLGADEVSAGKFNVFLPLLNHKSLKCCSDATGIPQPGKIIT